MIRSILFSSNGSHQENASIETLRVSIKNKEDLVWVDMHNSDPGEMQSILGDLFHFHPLAIEDCQSVGYQPPKVDDFGNYIFLVMHAVEPKGNFEVLDTTEINLFLGDNYLVTYHTENKPLHALESVWARLSKDERLYTNGSDFLCHAVLDVLVDDYMPLLDQMDEEIEWLEDTVLAKPDSKTLERILALKHSVMALRRIVAPQREVINRLTRDEFPMIDRKSRIYFRDIYDHLVRIQDLGESIRDIVTGALDIYLNSISLRLNEIMKALTIVSTIFLPLSFVAGVYGMNFHYMPEIYWRLGYLFAWVIFACIFIGMLLFFKKRGWF